MSADDEVLHGGPAHLCRRHHLFPRALHQLLQALPGRHLRARPRRSGAATTAPPASASAARTPRACASSAGSAAPTSTPISPIAALIAAGLKGIERQARARAGRSPATPMSARSCAKCTRPCATRPTALQEIEDAERRLRPGRHRPLRPHRRMGAVRIRPPRHRLGVEARVRTVVNTRQHFSEQVRS